MPNPLTPSEKQKLQNPYFGCNIYGIQNIRDERANFITIKKILNEFNFGMIVLEVGQAIQKKNNQEIRQQFRKLDEGIDQIGQQHHEIRQQHHEIRQQHHEIRQQLQNLDIGIAELEKQTQEIRQQSHNQDTRLAEIDVLVDKFQQEVKENNIAWEKAIAEDLERKEQARIQDEKREADLKQWKEERAIQGAKDTAEIDEKIKNFKEGLEQANKDRELHMERVALDHQARMAVIKENLRKQELQKLQKEKSKIEKLQEELARIEIEKDLLIKNTAKLENEIENEILPQDPIEPENLIDEVAEVIDPENAEIAEEVPAEEHEQSPIVQPLPSVELPQEPVLIEAAKTALETKVDTVIKEPLAILASPKVEAKPHFYVVNKKPEALVEKPKPRLSTEPTDQKVHKQNLLRKIVAISLKMLSLLTNLFIQWPKALAAYVWQKFEQHPPLLNAPKMM